MLKQRLLNLFIAVALLVALTGSVGIVADGLGLAVTSQAWASHCSGGGGC